MSIVSSCEENMFMTKRRTLVNILAFILGIYVGVKLSILCHNITRGKNQCGSRDNKAHDEGILLSEELDTKELLYVGVMTSGKFLESRAVSVYRTWAQRIPGKLQFFAGEIAGNSSKRTMLLPLVRLRGVDDTSYPPQRKSFMMLKYIYKHYSNRYKYFMRSDDDLYVRVDRLIVFLRGLDSAQDLFVGQAGVGFKDEREKLGLGERDNFCMGGTGIIMSNSALKKVVPHLEFCLKHMITSHEDVELGRCMRKHVGISCTWAFEMQWLFYHNQSKLNAYHRDLETSAVQNAITLHPIKDSSYIYRIHHHFQEKRILSLHQQSIISLNLLHRLHELLNRGKQLNAVSRINQKTDFHGTIPRNITSHWEMFDTNFLYSTSGEKIKMENSLRKSMNIILRNSLALINEKSEKRLFRKLILSKVNHGYFRVSPTHGVQYNIDLRMIIFQNIGYSRRKLPLNIHYQAHMQQFFGNLVYTSGILHHHRTTIHIIVPLAGRLPTFEAFLTNLEKVALANNLDIKLLVIYFPDVSSSTNHKKLVKVYQKNYPNFQVSWKDFPGAFSRGIALQFGSIYYGRDSLLFFCDVDLIFDREFLRRCQYNTIKGKSIYYPIVFSQFNQSFWQRGEQERTHAQNRGFWRQYGYGTVCVYSDDVELVGGFDTTIKGWGLEDVNLYERFISARKYEIYRVPDPGLIHIHHKAVCTQGMEHSRRKMCTSSKLAQLASAGSLVDHMQQKGYL